MLHKTNSTYIQINYSISQSLIHSHNKYLQTDIPKTHNKTRKNIFSFLNKNVLI